MKKKRTKGSKRGSEKEGSLKQLSLSLRKRKNFD